MIIGIDANEANIQSRVGVNQYLFHLLHEFASDASKQRQFVLFLKHQPLEDMPAQTAHFRYQVIPPARLWLQLGLSRYLLTHPRVCDVFFAPAHYAPYWCPVPTIITIHDLAYEYFPNDFLKRDRYKLSNWTRRSASGAKAIIAVSQHTKRDIIQTYGVPEQNIHVIYNGFETKKPTQSNDVLQRYELETQQYIIALGTLQPRKNLVFLIKSYLDLVEHNKRFATRVPKLVIVGKKGWKHDTINSYATNSRLVFTDYVDESTKATLLSHAQCLVHPSLYEGFGIPILEAMSLGCPVICSSSSSLSEVGADACLYFDPTDKHQLQQQLVNIQDAHVRESLVQKGRERVKDFSWKLCANQTLQLLTQP